MMMQASAPPVHWTTYVQTFAVIASTIGTFVYVWFTYHIMKWAVGQGKASVDVARVSLEQERGRTYAILDNLLKEVLALRVRYRTDPALKLEGARGVLETWSRLFDHLRILAASGDLPIPFAFATKRAKRTYRAGLDLLDKCERLDDRVGGAALDELQETITKMNEHRSRLAKLCDSHSDVLVKESLKSEIWFGLGK